MTDLEEIMKAGLRDLADEAPDGDELWVETEEEDRGAEAAAPRLHHRERPRDRGRPHRGDRDALGRTERARRRPKSRSTQPGGVAKQTPTSLVAPPPSGSMPKPPDPLPAGTLILGVDGRRIVVLDAKRP